MLMEECRPDEWAATAEVQDLLATMLEHPGGDHEAAVARLLGGELLDAHVAGIVRLLRGLRSGAFPSSFTRDAAVALHTVIYHLLGGASTQRPAPPLEATREAKKRCGSGWATAEPAADKFFTQMRQARQDERQGDSRLMHSLCSRIFDPDRHKNLRPGGSPPQHLAKKQTAALAAAAAAPPAPPPPDPADAELRRRADCCLALAMGTHQRLGMSSGLRLLAGEEDALRLIAAHAELHTTIWLARPPPK